MEESHGWFPNSMKVNAVVSPAAVNGPTEGQKGNKKNMLTRRPSGLEIGVTSDPSLPPVAIPDQMTAGIKRLPTAKMGQDSFAEAPAQHKTSIRLPQANSLANLPTKSTVQQQSAVKRVRSSTNVSKTQERVVKSVQTKPRDRPKLQKSYTTPSRFEEPEESRNHKKNSNSSLANNVNGGAASKKVK